MIVLTRLSADNVFIKKMTDKVRVINLPVIIHFRPGIGTIGINPNVVHRISGKVFCQSFYSSRTCKKQGITGPFPGASTIVTYTQSIVGSICYHSTIVVEKTSLVFGVFTPGFIIIPPSINQGLINSRRRW